MLLVSDLVAEEEAVKQKLRKRNFKEMALVDRVMALDADRKRIQTQKDQLLAKRNELSRAIGTLYQSGQRELAEEKKKETGRLKEEIALLDASGDEVAAQLRETLLNIPNVPHESVPAGNSENDNEIVFETAELPELPENKLPHWDLAEKYGIIDFETAVKITGSGFAMFRGKGAVLQRALISYFLDQAAEAGYLEVVPPLMVNEDSAYATGQLPDKEGQMYHIGADNLYMIPTAEVPITNIYRDRIVEESELPVKLAGYTPCFRREAGSYGSHVRGLNRVHQFDKVEIVQVVKPEDSYETLNTMVAHVENLLRQLELPYRIVRLCGGDLGFTSALTFDFEVWSGGQERWLEVSSVSNFESYQANRLRLRYRDADKKNRLCHTLNGSALALARIIACLLENNQTQEGIRVPRVLQPYTRFKMIS